MSDHYPLLTLEELFKLKPPRREWLVDGLLARGEAGILDAREKAGKGLIVIDLMASIANEEPFLDRAVSACKVAYFAAEESLLLIQERIAARMGPNREPPFLVLPLNTILVEGEEPSRFKLTEALHLERLIGTIKHYDLGLVVLDTFRELHDLPENESDYMAPLLRPLRQISHDLNVTILTNHHQNRNNQFRGSTSILAAVDFEWSFVRTDDDDAAMPAGRLKYKGRQPQIAVPIAFGEGGRWHVATGLTELVDVSVEGRIQQWLKHAKQWQAAEDIAKVLSDPSYKLKTIQNALTAMAKRGEVQVRRAESGRGGKKEYHALALELDGLGELSQTSGTNGRESLGHEIVPSDLSFLSSPLRELEKEGQIASNGVGTNGTCLGCKESLPAGKTIFCGPSCSAAYREVYS